MIVALESIRPDKVVDARDMRRPGPVLSLNKAIHHVDLDQIIELLTTDRAMYDDLSMWAHRTGNEYLGALLREGYESHFVLRQQ